jgi:hypothetical protein
MEFADLHVFPKGHPPSPRKSGVLIVKVGSGFLPKGLRLCSVGWLEKPGFPTGVVSQKCIKALITAHPGGIFSDGCRGIHGCTLCGRIMPKVRWRNWTVHLKGHGHYLVRMDDMVYMAPELLLHYIRGHRYCPPQEFVDAVIHGTFLGEDDLDIKWRKKGS